MTGVFETQTLRVCPTEPIICVKEKKQSLLFFPILPTATSFNNNIKGGSKMNLANSTLLNFSKSYIKLNSEKADD